MAEALAQDYLASHQWAELEPILLELWERTRRASMAYFLGIAASDRSTELIAFVRDSRIFQGVQVGCFQHIHT